MSEDFIAVAKVGDLAPGEMKWVAVDRVRLVLANVDGEFYAIRDVCGHKNAPLSRGRLDGCMIECSLHFAIFDIRTGKFVHEVRVDGGTIYVKR
jgi:3-phenylpropionate/trans-cinnamate dioxygenase ferredoxin subunit